MKYLGPPAHNDLNTIRALAQNTRVKSYPMLQILRDAIEGRYRRYEAVRGNAWRMQLPLQLSGELADALKTHYATMPGDLGVIKQIRKEGSPDVCPMCGSAKSGEVDHVAPKDTYPEYSFFTRNLVPACDCNGLKKLTFKGNLRGQRILHPYYDAILNSRLVFIRFCNDFDRPDLNVEICQAFAGDHAVNFHVDSILRKTTILSWASKKWAAIRRNPESQFTALKTTRGQVPEPVVRHAISLQLDGKDEEYGTPNNWYSMVYSGLLFSPGATDYITQRLNGLRSGTILPD